MTGGCRKVSSCFFIVPAKSSKIANILYAKNLQSVKE